MTGGGSGHGPGSEESAGGGSGGSGAGSSSGTGGTITLTVEEIEYNGYAAAGTASGSTETGVGGSPEDIGGYGATMTAGNHQSKQQMQEVASPNAALGTTFWLLLLLIFPLIWYLLSRIIKDSDNTTPKRKRTSMRSV